MSEYLDKSGAQYVINALKEKINAKMDSVTLATVATSGSYSDLSNKPSIPTVTNTYSSTSNNAMSGVAVASAVAGVTVSSIGAIPASQKGVANGVATLDANGVIPSAQLPSYVDDVLEYANKTYFPATGESGKIYVAKDTNLPYRWTGTTYVEIAGGLALGETSSTAYAGDKGKAVTDGLASHKSDTTSHITAAERTAWNGKTSVTESTVSGWGFTKNAGTVTSVKMNGSTKSPSSGVVDLGTVITAHQDISGKQDKITSTNKLAYSLISGTPTIPTVTDTYSATSSSAMSGKAVASALGSYVKSSDLTPITTEELATMLA